MFSFLSAGNPEDQVLSGVFSVMKVDELPDPEINADNQVDAFYPVLC